MVCIVFQWARCFKVHEITASSVENAFSLSLLRALTALKRKSKSKKYWEKKRKTQQNNLRQPNFSPCSEQTHKKKKEKKKEREKQSQQHN